MTQTHTLNWSRLWFCFGLCGILLALLLWSIGPTTRYVTASGNAHFAASGGSGDCSQATPCNLHTAVAQANDGDTIYLAQGRYTSTNEVVIALNNSITLTGGWDGAPTGPVTHDPVTHPSTLDGEGVRRVAAITGPATVTLEGLTLANGKTISTTTGGWNGAGLYAQDVNLTLQSTNFYSNVTDVYDYDTPTSYAYGGGVYMEGGTIQIYASTFQANSTWARRQSAGGGAAISGTITAIIENSRFQENDAWNASGLYFAGTGGTRPAFALHDSTFVDNGLGRSLGRASGGYAGALQIINAQGRIAGNTFTGNNASNDYGAVGVFYTDLFFTRNLIYNNRCARTAGLYLNSVTPFTITNNIIAGNRSTYDWFDSPAVRVRSGSGDFLHNTISRNHSAYGVQVDSGANVALTNTLLVSHTVGISVTAGSTALLEGTLWGSGYWANGTDWDGAGNILTGTVNLWGPPVFVNPASGDYHIGPGSAAIDAGVSTNITVDIDDDARPIGTRYDIGADEVWQQRIYLPLVLKVLTPNR